MAQPAPRGLAGMLAALFAALVLYASLYPFSGWRWPPGRTPADLLALPWPIYRIPFDIVANGLGYAPLGFLVALAALRAGRRPWLAVGLGALLPAVLSYAAEVTQHFLPGRHPSLMDLALNAVGAAFGALLAPLLVALGWPQRAAQTLQRWFDADAGGALLLLALWPVGLLFPTPVALGMGQIGPRLRPLLADALAGVPWAEPWHAALAAASPGLPLGAASAGLATALGLLAPCLVAFAVVRPGWHRLGLVIGAGALTGAVMTLATALNFGPQHGLAWLAPGTLPALALGAAAAGLLAGVPRRIAAGLGLMVITALVVLVAQAPADPYLEQSLIAWEQGRFIRFHGLARWVGWLWPYAALLWLLARLSARPA